MSRRPVPLTDEAVLGAVRDLGTATPWTVAVRLGVWHWDAAAHVANRAGDGGEVGVVPPCSAGRGEIPLILC